MACSYLPQPPPPWASIPTIVIFSRTSAPARYRFSTRWMRSKNSKTPPALLSTLTWMTSGTITRFVLHFSARHSVQQCLKENSVDSVQAFIPSLADKYAAASRTASLKCYPVFLCFFRSTQRSPSGFADAASTKSLFESGPGLCRAAAVCRRRFFEKNNQRTPCDCRKDAESIHSQKEQISSAFPRSRGPDRRSVVEALVARV